MSQHRIDRSDHDWRDIVQSALARNCHFAGKNVQVELDDRDIVLKGVVQSYYHKQLAQESIRQIEGVERIRNEIEVAAPF